MKARRKHWVSALVILSLLLLTAWAGAPRAQAAACRSTGAGGAWENAATWTDCNGGSPGSGDSAQILDGDTVALGVGTWVVGSTTVDSGGTLVLAKGIHNNSSFTVNGALVIAEGGWVDTLSPVYGSSATLRYANASNYGLGLEWTATNGPNNVDIANGPINGLNMNGASRTVNGLFQTNGPVTNGNLTIGGTGTLQINSGGWLSFAPTYGTGSLLKYNSGGTYGRNQEWSATSGTGCPYHVQISGGAGLDLGANGGTTTAWTVPGDLTIDSGCGFYMDYGSNDMTVPVRVGGNVTVNGTLSLSELINGDIEVAGNWVNNGAFNCRGRRVTFTGSGVQSIGGSSTSTFDYLLIDNLDTGDVTLAGDIVVLHELKINDSSAEFSAGPATITMQGNAGAGPAWVNNGAFNRGTGTVAWTGENNQNGRVLGSAVTTFYNVTLNRNSGGSSNFGVDLYDHDTARRAHVAGTLTLNVNTFVASEEDGSSTGCAPANCDGTPVYDAGSTLHYNNSGTFDSAAEWWPDDADPLCNVDKGMPYNVVVDNSTTVNIDAAFANNGQGPNYGAGSNKTACGSVTINSGSTLQSTAGVFSVKDNWTRIGTFTHNNGTVQFNGNGGSDGVQAVTGDTTFYNLTLSPQSGVTAAFGATTTTVAHNLDKTGGSGSMDPGTGKFSFVGAPSGILGDGKKVFYDLEIAGGTTNHTSGTGEVYIHHNYTNNGTFNQDAARYTYFDDEISGNTTVHSLSGSGTTTLGKVDVFTLDTLNAGTHNVTIVGSEFWVATGATFNGGSATVTFGSASPGTDLRGAGAYNFNHLVISTGAILLGVDSSTNNKTFHVAGNWTNNGTFTHNSGATHFNGTGTIGGSAVTSFFDILIESACSVTGPAGTVNVAHDWTNNGTYTAGSSTVALNGSTTQVIGGASTTTFYALNINNVAGVSLGHNQRVNSGLTLSDGLLALGPYDLVLAAIGVSGSGLGPTKMIVADGAGSLCRTFSGMQPMFTYPIGDTTGGANYSPVYLAFYWGTWGQACVRVADAKHPNNPSPTNYLTRYWVVTSPDVGGIRDFNCSASLYYDATAEDIVGTEGNIYDIKYDSGTWTYGNLLDAASHRIYWTGLGSFSDFTGGSQPTAVDLVSFGAVPHADGVLLSWETANEFDNVGFHLYRSTSLDALGEQLDDSLIPARVPGSGAGAYYEFADTTALPEVTYYYTLEDVDVNGQATAHGPVTMTLWRAYLPVVR